MENCVFCKIVLGKVPCYKIYEDEYVLAFLDIFPASKGQTLVIPREHRTDYVFNIEDSLYSKLFIISKKITRAIDKAFNTERTCLVIEGFEVGHPHIKLYPCYERRLNLRPMENKPSEEGFKKTAEEIKKLL